MTLLEASETALSELIRLHDLYGSCDGIESCPAAQAIKALQDAINDAKFPAQAEATEIAIMEITEVGHEA